MSLTIGTAPFGQRPGGRFNFDPPDHVVYVERFPRRVRAERRQRVVIDSDEVVLVHESGGLPHYAFPAGDVRVPAAPEPHAEGFVTVAWQAVDAWYEEDEQVHVHPRDPYHRIDTFSTSRRVTVSVDGVQLADSTRVSALYETSLPIRWYFPPEDVSRELLEPSDTVTQCAYKGTARHWSARLGDRAVRDLAWSYGDDVVQREGERVRGLIAFYDERVDVDIEGARQDRPETTWSRQQ